MLGTVIKRAQLGLLIAAYPLIIYLLITYNAAWVGAALVLGAIVWKIRHRKDALWWVGGLLALVLVAGHFFGVDTIPKLSPLLIHIGLFALFYQSLRGVPLIERFARLDFEVIPPAVVLYCRRLTQVWSAFFALNILVCLWLALWGDDRVWALYNGLIVYLLIAALMLGEYAWRHLAFPDLDIPPLSQSVRNMIKNGHTIWGGGQDGRA